MTGDALSAFDETQPIGADALQELLRVSEEFIQLSVQISDIEQLLKTLKGRYQEMNTKTIPDKMAAVGLSEFKTPAGNSIKVEDFVQGSLPKEVEKRAAAIKTLEEWGADGVIKSEINLAFEKSQHNLALALVDELRLKGFEVELESGVHPQTYLSLMRERMAKGEQIDFEAMGIFAGRKCKVTIAKGEKL